jgi:hypothetical protein
MDNIGDWIYLIIFGIAAVAGLFKEFKKKTSPTATPKPVAKKAENAAPPATKPAVKRASPKQSRPVEKQPAPFLTVDTLRDHNAIPDDEPILTENEEEQNAPTLDAQNVDEIRRAIIYSEILGRRY